METDWPQSRGQRGAESLCGDDHFGITRRGTRCHFVGEISPLDPTRGSLGKGGARKRPVFIAKAPQPWGERDVGRRATINTFKNENTSSAEIEKCFL